MRSCSLILAFLLLPAGTQAQDTFRPDARVGAFAGAGEGPSPTGVFGLQGEVPVTANVGLRVEGSRWAQGLAPCEHEWPSSCDGSAWAALAGVYATFGRLLQPYAQVSAGVFSLSGTVSDGAKLALDFGAGLRINALGRLSVRIGARRLSAPDERYERVIGQELDYTMGVLGLEYRLGR